MVAIDDIVVVGKFFGSALSARPVRARNVEGRPKRRRLLRCTGPGSDRAEYREALSKVSFDQRLEKAGGSLLAVPHSTAAPYSRHLGRLLNTAPVGSASCASWSTLKTAKRQSLSQKPGPRSCCTCPLPARQTTYKPSTNSAFLLGWLHPQETAGSTTRPCRTTHTMTYRS